MVDTVNDLGEPRVSGFYIGVFESAARDGNTIRAVAWRRSAHALVSIRRVDTLVETQAVIEALLHDGVALNDIYPLTISVGRVDRIDVGVLFPDVKG